jgi:hypothetical protein
MTLWFSSGPDMPAHAWYKTSSNIRISSVSYLSFTFLRSYCLSIYLPLPSKSHNEAFIDLYCTRLCIGCRQRHSTSRQACRRARRYAFHILFFRAVKLTSPFTDTTVLNFALTLEHLENAFYEQGLAKYDAKAFANAGYPSYVHGRFTQIAQHEKAHVAFLSNALGDKATKPCQYNLYARSGFVNAVQASHSSPSPHNDPKSFVAISQALEGVGMCTPPSYQLKGSKS